MHPPDSCNPSRPPAYGQQPPGQYPAQYPGQYPGQYPPQYQYPYYGPPPKPDRSGKLIAIIVLIVVLVIVVPIAIAGFLVVYLQTLPDGGGAGTVETNLDLRVETMPAGGWLVSVTSGTKPASSVTLQVINPSTGAPTVSKLVSALAPTYADPDARYNDNNGNHRLDAGDTIQLQASGGHIHAGYKVQLLVGESIVGMIRELPA